MSKTTTIESNGRQVAESTPAQTLAGSPLSPKAAASIRAKIRRWNDSIGYKAKIGMAAIHGGKNSAAHHLQNYATERYILAEDELVAAILRVTRTAETRLAPETEAPERVVQRPGGVIVGSRMYMAVPIEDRVDHPPGCRLDCHAMRLEIVDMSAIRQA